nr:hypothetical protein [Tanacetum cinerariifolium]
MKEEFFDWFESQRHVENDKDPEVSTTSELFALACGPTWTPISINSCVVDGVRYVVHSRDERRITQNSGICLPGLDGEMYYGQLQEILEFNYLLFKVVLFQVKWFDTHNQGRKVKRLVLRNNTTQIDTRAESFKDDQYILVTQVKQVFYLKDKVTPYWRVVEHVNHKKCSDGGVIVVKVNPDIIHFDNSSDLPLSTSLNDLDNATLHIDGQSTEVDVPLDIIIDVVDEDDDITDDEDSLPHDLAESDNEDLINVDDDGVDKMSVDVAGPTAVTVEVRIAPSTPCKGKRKPNLCDRAAGRLNTRDKTRNLSLKEITDMKGPVPIQFESRDKKTVMPLCDHAAHWSSYTGEVIRAYNTNKAAFKAHHWVIDPTTGTYNLEKIRRERPENITTSEWDKYIEFWNDPGTLPEPLKIGKTGQRARSYLDRDPGRLLAFEMRGRPQPLRRTRRSLTHSSWHTLLTGNSFGTRTDVYTVLPVRATASLSMPAHESTLNSLHKKVDFMMSIFKSDSKYSDMFSQFESGGASGSGGCGDEEEGADHQDDEDEEGDGDT